MNLYPVILAGGCGTRLWPLSRESHPKQFLSILDGDASPYQATLARAAAIGRAREPIVVTNREHRFIAAEQARAAKRALRRIYVEPFGRGTAPAAALVAHELVAEDRDAVMLVMPSDHDIGDAAAFAAAVATGLAAAATGRLVVFGIEPRWVETGYGYVERAGPLADAPGCHDVASFVEKPELEIAERLAASGRHSWNSGIFLLSAHAYLEELERLEPELAAACRGAARASSDDAGFRLVDEAAFGLCRDISVDRAVLERTNRAALVPAAFPWSDIGSWDALWERGAKDAARNECHGDVQLHDVSGSYVHSSHRLVVGIGLEDLVVIETPDALLVARRGETQRVREAVEKLRASGRSEHRVHRRVHRPWGCYEDIDSGERFRVKRITVEPGRKLSLQWHHHRAEHWVIVSGTARVTRGEETMLLAENQSIYIPVGETHRLENPGKVPLRLIEVQTGSYLGEDDIVRVDDEWHREREAAR
ncbi:MAG TPA: mannose-1-phosphate guanylyltransferase/mannose-6-phosphate isomerase [Usitatibacter sp.]|nr:mannose-1-phosphate guanylyltransferase/mannose-6-phosphate isomerase [Usitatibacter sp.]